MEVAQSVMATYSAAVTYGPVYHGGKERCLVLDPKFAGTGAVNGGYKGSANRSGGIYFSSLRKAAEFFADPCEIVRDERTFTSDDYTVYGEGPYCVVIGMDGDIINPPTHFKSEDDAEEWSLQFIKKWNAAEPGDVVFEDDLIFTALLTMHNPLIVHSFEDFREAESSAKDDGHDGIIGYDICDGALHSDIYVVFESKQITLLQA
jgi:hypothetical protein